MNRQTTRKKMVGTIATLMVLAICVLVLETLLHVYFYAGKKYWLFRGRDAFTVPYVTRVADRRQYALRKNATNETTSINAAGFRGPPLRTDDRRPVICIVGDSVPFGAGVTDDQTFPAHLQRILDDGGYQYRVLNGGVPSYNLRQAIDRWDIDIRPQYGCALLILNAANDVSLIAYYKQSWTPELTWASARFGILGVSRSSILYYLNVALTWGRAHLQTGRDWQKKALESLQADFSTQIERPIAAGIPVVHLPINPCYYTNLPIGEPANSTACQGAPEFAAIVREWDDLIRSINVMLRRQAARPNNYMIDSVGAFDGPLGRNGKFVDFIHFSDEGNRDMARLIADFLVSHGLIR
jgi:lysophospholipase L1-like esterase